MEHDAGGVDHAAQRRPRARGERVAHGGGPAVGVGGRGAACVARRDAMASRTASTTSARGACVEQRAHAVALEQRAHARQRAAGIARALTGRPAAAVEAVLGAWLAGWGRARGVAGAWNCGAVVRAGFALRRVARRGRARRLHGADRLVAVSPSRLRHAVGLESVPCARHERRIAVLSTYSVSGEAALRHGRGGSFGTVPRRGRVGRLRDPAAARRRCRACPRIESACAMESVRALSYAVHDPTEQAAARPTSRCSPANVKFVGVERLRGSSGLVEGHVERDRVLHVETGDPGADRIVHRRRRAPRRPCRGTLTVAVSHGSSRIERAIVVRGRRKPRTFTGPGGSVPSANRPVESATRDVLRAVGREVSTARSRSARGLPVAQSKTMPLMTVGGITGPVEKTNTTARLIAVVL